MSQCASAMHRFDDLLINFAQNRYLCWRYVDQPAFGDAHEAANARQNLAKIVVKILPDPVLFTLTNTQAFEFELLLHLNVMDKSSKKRSTTVADGFDNGMTNPCNSSVFRDQSVIHREGELFYISEEAAHPVFIERVNGFLPPDRVTFADQEDGINEGSGSWEKGSR